MQPWGLHAEAFRRMFTNLGGHQAGISAPWCVQRVLRITPEAGARYRSHPGEEDAMKSIRAILASLLLLSSTAPARADFKYTDTSQITGGALLGMAKFTSILSKEARKQEQDALQPTTTTYYVKGNRLRTDRSDGTVHVIDLDARRILEIDPQKRTYSVATFDEIKAAVQQAQQNMQQQAQQDPQLKNAQVTVTPTFRVTPGPGGRVILNEPTTETKIQMDIQMQAQTGTQPPSQPAGPNSATYSMNIDMFVAPAVAGYQEITRFYRSMAQEINWVPPSNLRVDPRMSQGMAELQKNSDALKGFPLLSYMSMTVGLPGQPPPDAAQNPGATSPSPSASNTASNNSPPDNATAAVMKGLGGLFGRKQQPNTQAQTTTLPPNPNPNPNSLMDMTTQVSSFSDSTLDSSLFDIPTGFTLVQVDPAQIMGTRQRPQPTN
jgi:hypothetical protein